mgnify:CR=1 FL=1
MSADSSFPHEITSFSERADFLLTFAAAGRRGTKVLHAQAPGQADRVCKFRAVEIAGRA